MKKILLNLTLIILLIVCLFNLVGCGNNSDNVNNNEEEKNMLDNTENIVGTWQLNRNVRVNDDKYNSLNSLLGDSYGSDILELKSDGTFELSAGMLYNLKGNYDFKNNELSFSNVSDINIKREDALKDIEENLKLQYIKYNGHEFFKMYLYDITDCEGYIFYERNPSESAGSYADDAVPDVEFMDNKSEEINADNISNDKKEYIGVYKNNKGDKLEITADNDGKIYLAKNDNKSEIDLTTSHPVGIITLNNITKLINNAKSAYIYPIGVSFSLSSNPGDYEENETDSTRIRIYISTGESPDESSVYYKE